MELTKFPGSHRHSFRQILLRIRCLSEAILNICMAQLGQSAKMVNTVSLAVVSSTVWDPVTYANETHMS